MPGSGVTGSVDSEGPVEITRPMDCAAFLCALCPPVFRAVILGWALERGEGLQGGRAKTSPPGRQHPDLDYLGAVRLSCGHRGICTKAGKKCVKLHLWLFYILLLNNESISGSETPLIHLSCTNHIVGTKEEQAKDFEVDVMELWISPGNGIPQDGSFHCPFQVRRLSPLGTSLHLPIVPLTLSHHVSDIGTDAQEKCARQRLPNLAVISNAYLTPKQPLVSDRVSELVFQKVLDIMH